MVGLFDLEKILLKPIQQTDLYIFISCVFWMQEYFVLVGSLQIRLAISISIEGIIMPHPYQLEYHFQLDFLDYL